MNTRWIMTGSAYSFGFMGLCLTFLPNEISGIIGVDSTTISALFLQIIGSLYFAFAMLNWMAKGSIIGGIYNRPLVVANFTHFFVGGMAIGKAIFEAPDSSELYWFVAGLYFIFAVLFGMLLFHFPLSNKAV